MTKHDDLNDSLDDLLGAPVQQRVLPQDPGLVAARAAAESFTETCPKCRGTGKFVGYTGRVFGDCFACKGKGSKSFKTAPQVRAAARQRTALAKAEVIADHQAELAWLAETLQRADRMPEGYATMLRDFQSRLQAGHSLSDKQMAVITKGMERSAQWKAERAQKAVERSVEIDATLIEKAFQRAREAGKIKLGLHYDGVYFGPKRGNPDIIYVKASKDYEATYYGKIEGGRFFPSWNCNPEITAKIVVIAADPAAAAVASGKDTGICCCCGLTLTNELSVELGIGPICRGKWGF